MFTDRTFSLWSVIELFFSHFVYLVHTHAHTGDVIRNTTNGVILFR